MKKRLTRSSENRVFVGVLGGISEYFDVDPVLVRVLFLFAIAITGFFPGAVAYVLAILIVPRGPVRAVARDASAHDAGAV